VLAQPKFNCTNSITYPENKETWLGVDGEPVGAASMPLALSLPLVRLSPGTTEAEKWSGNGVASWRITIAMASCFCYCNWNLNRIGRVFSLGEVFMKTVSPTGARFLFFVAKSQFGLQSETRRPTRQAVLHFEDVLHILRETIHEVDFHSAPRAKL
jgi:hypothetical protein